MLKIGESDKNRLHSLHEGTTSPGVYLPLSSGPRYRNIMVAAFIPISAVYAAFIKISSINAFARSLKSMRTSMPLDILPGVFTRSKLPLLSVRNPNAVYFYKVFLLPYSVPFRVKPHNPRRSPLNICDPTSRSQTSLTRSPTTSL